MLPWPFESVIQYFHFGSPGSGPCFEGMTADVTASALAVVAFQQHLLRASRADLLASHPQMRSACRQGIFVGTGP